MRELEGEQVLMRIFLSEPAPVGCHVRGGW